MTLLYHGTTKPVALKAARGEGLAPRGDGKGTWVEPSHPNMVYLTDAYAAFYAWHTRTVSVGRRARAAIVEVDTDALSELDMRPDEDALEQMTRDVLDTPLQGSSMIDRTTWYRERLDAYAHTWPKTLAALGVVSHKGLIPPQAITRVAILPVRAPVLNMMCVDPAICLLNYLVCGGKYRALTASIFERKVTDEMRECLTFGGLLPEQHLASSVDRLDAELADVDVVLSPEATRRVVA